jgi:CBS domain-containing protein
VSVPTTATVADAARLMEHAGVGSLLVMDGDRLAGIVTDRDLALRVVALRSPYDGRVDAVMTCNVVTLQPSASRHDAVSAFRRHAVRRLPVVDGERVVGVVALDDVLAAGSVEDLPLVRDMVGGEIAHPHHESPLPVPVHAESGSPQPGPEKAGPTGRMRAKVGDEVVVHGRTTEIPKRTGEILGVGTPAGDPPYRIRWDDGRVSFFYPGPDMELHRLGGVKTAVEAT